VELMSLSPDDQRRVPMFAHHLRELAELGPARSYEDVPIQIGLYPFLQVKDGALVVRGSRTHGVLPQPQLREGYRWGASAAWDRQTPAGVERAFPDLAGAPAKGGGLQVVAG
jgi:hypothetical protein